MNLSAGFAIPLEGKSAAILESMLDSSTHQFLPEFVKYPHSVAGTLRMVSEMVSRLFPFFGYEHGTAMDADDLAVQSSFDFRHMDQVTFSNTERRLYLQ